MYIQGGSKVGIQYIVYRIVLPSLTIPVKKKIITVYLLLTHRV